MEFQSLLLDLKIKIVHRSRKLQSTFATFERPLYKIAIDQFSSIVCVCPWHCCVLLVRSNSFIELMLVDRNCTLKYAEWKICRIIWDFSLSFWETETERERANLTLLFVTYTISNTSNKYHHVVHTKLNPIKTEIFTLLRYLLFICSPTRN